MEHEHNFISFQKGLACEYLHNFLLERNKYFANFTKEDVNSEF